MVEQNGFQPILWEGAECQLSKQQGMELITSLGEAGKAEYQRAKGMVIGRAQETVAQLQALDLFDPSIPIPTFTPRLAVLPRHEFEPMLFKNMDNPQDWAWAQACVRAFDGKSFVLYDSSIATPAWEAGETMPVDQQREIIHEFAHPWLLRGLKPGRMHDFTTNGSISFHEVVVETVPRVLLGLQHKMPDSTRFLLSLQQDQVLPVGVIDRTGWGCFPPKPLKENSMYGGIFLAGLAAIDKLGQGDFTKGTARLVQTAQLCDDPPQLWNALADQGVEKEWLLETREPIVRGKELLSMYTGIR